jgi:tetratricopeptide (TPR) repeat protein
MKMSNFRKVQKEFFVLTRILLQKRVTNRIDANTLPNNFTFSLLAEKIFDYPNILRFLKKKIKNWLSIDKSENTFLLAGYIYYLDNDFDRARKYFLKAVESNPENLDNWLDLAFCLYHCPEKINELAKDILFNFDLFIQFFKKFKYNKCTLKALKEIQKKIIDKKLGYSYTYAKYIDNRDLKRIIKSN